MMATFVDFCSEGEQALLLARLAHKCRSASASANPSSSSSSDDLFLKECEQLAAEKELPKLLAKIAAETPRVVDEGNEKGER